MIRTAEALPPLIQHPQKARSMALATVRELKEHSARVTKFGQFTCTGIAPELFRFRLTAGGFAKMLTKMLGKILVAEVQAVPPSV
jgi:hypothetical protein